MTDEELIEALDKACPWGGWGAYRVCLPFVPKLRAMLESALRRYPETNQ